MASVDALVMGRNTFDKVLTLGKWPYGTKRVLVISSGPVNIPSNMAPSVESSALTPSELLAKLVQEGVNHIYVDGGKTIQRFLREGLVDELIITMIPRLLGEGISLFGSLKQDILLKLIKMQSYPNGLVQTHYQIER